MNQHHNIGELFVPEPSSWGLRGDPYLWREMRKHFSEVPLPSSVANLELQLEQAFLLLTGHPMSTPSHFRVERFAHGGMSSGGISTDFWRERAMLLFKKRYARRKLWKSEHGKFVTPCLPRARNPKSPEPSTAIIKFPGGHVEVCRTSDNRYWAHAEVLNPENIQESRVDYNHEGYTLCGISDIPHADKIKHLAVLVSVRDDQSALEKRCFLRDRIRPLPRAIRWRMPKGRVVAPKHPSADWQSSGQRAVNLGA